MGLGLCLGLGMNNSQLSGLRRANVHLPTQGCVPGPVRGEDGQGEVCPNVPRPGEGQGGREERSAREAQGWPAQKPLQTSVSPLACEDKCSPRAPPKPQDMVGSGVLVQSGRPGMGSTLGSCSRRHTPTGTLEGSRDRVG